LTRLLPAQIMAGVLFALIAAAPLIVRYLISFQFLPALSIVMGGVFVVLFAVAFGILSGGKKLFEILFFMVAYTNVELVPYTDYFGGMNHGINYIVLIAVLIGLLALVSFVLRRM